MTGRRSRRPGRRPVLRWLVASAVVVVGTQVASGLPEAFGGSPPPVRVVVQPGDTLSEIAVAHGVTVADLVAANHIADPGLVRAGVTLTIPRSKALAGTGLPGELLADRGRLALRPVFAKWAEADGLDPALLEAVCWMESGWQNGVVSPVGAVGIGQLMPDAAAHMQALIGQPLDPVVPEDNIRMSARLLRWLLVQTGGDKRLALAAYAQGLRSVQTIGPKPEVELYVDDVVALQARFD